MELKVWVKTFFSIYKWLDKLAKSVDGYVALRGVSCFYKNLNSISLCNTEKVVRDITGLMNKKINLINIKHICDKMLCNLPEKFARFVIAKYVDNHTFEEVANILDINIRTAMRWNVAVVQQCQVFLQNWGYTESKILNLIDYEKWIIDVAKNIKLQEENNHSKKIAYFMIFHEAEKAYKKYMI